jgi:hypothetical protein
VNGYILLPILPIISMMNKLMRSIYQEEELSTSFVVEPGAALDSLVGDGADFTVL